MAGNFYSQYPFTYEETMSSTQTEKSGESSAVNPRDVWSEPIYSSAPPSSSTDPTSVPHNGVVNSQVVHSAVDATYNAFDRQALNHKTYQDQERQWALLLPVAQEVGLQAEFFNLDQQLYPCDEIFTPHGDVDDYGTPTGASMELSYVTSPVIDPALLPYDPAGIPRTLPRVEIPPVYECDICGSTKCNSEASLKRHRDRHSAKEYSCKQPGCKYICKKPTDLDRHAKVHTKKRPFVCSHCFKSFSRKDNCKRHEKDNCKTVKQ